MWNSIIDTDIGVLVSTSVIICILHYILFDFTYNIRCWLIIATQVSFLTMLGPIWMISDVNEENVHTMCIT